MSSISVIIDGKKERTRSTRCIQNCILIFFFFFMEATTEPSPFFFFYSLQLHWEECDALGELTGEDFVCWYRLYPMTIRLNRSADKHA